MEIDFMYFKYMPNTKIVNDILQLHTSIFGESNQLVRQMESKPDLLIHLALAAEKVVGYKIGYMLDDEKFYSWLGGVDEKYRNLGIASKLMENQHQYLVDHNYKKVQTKTKNQWRNMLILNIKHGFDVIGTYTNDHGEPKIILEKKLLEEKS
ncbi:GNAT family N-acetyltransferase [Heyndrickxia sp. NPDC080065]|uniref:GNAT family N-acetyltransferase n=1 Tax=Heyndrickxia sp. NPDC080065 TaxID=3390568 RepID=UPI003D060B3A